MYKLFTSRYKNWQIYFYQYIYKTLKTKVNFRGLLVLNNLKKNFKSFFDR